MICIAATQPRPRISPPAIGAITNWPNEPPALTMPVARPRRSAGISRVVAAINTAGPAMPAPPADSTPMARISPRVLVISGVITVPSATRAAPISNTRPAPSLSAMAPANGWVRPQNSWPKANARLMLPSPSPVAVLSGPRNSPIDWRVPIVSAKVPAAASSTSQTGQSLGARPVGGVARAVSVMVGLR